ncbi:MAG: nucleotidyltransferase [Candidatus Marinimicrobia bacterium]|nr:nucleotidyltransferase [Candidatus Neomarinimicrobiota bacterium]RKY55744.1 MAG: hypothetical protein DRP96_12100 [Candidatus Neomarinimicrobiota bacterium]
MNLLAHPLFNALKKLVDWLNRQKIPYMVFGGIANTIYGNPRQTFDIDIKIILESGNSVGDFVKSIQTIAEIRPEDPLAFFTDTQVLPVIVAGVPVDIIRANLPFEKEAIQRAETREYGGVKLKLCTPEDLIIQKVVSKRAKDWDDIKIIIEQQLKQLDRHYLLNHCQELSILLDRPELFSTIKGYLDEL